MTPVYVRSDLGYLEDLKPGNDAGDANRSAFLRVRQDRASARVLVAFLLTFASAGCVGLAGQVGLGWISKTGLVRARNVAKGAFALSQHARTATTALVDGRIGIAALSGGHVHTVLTLAFKDGKITDIDVIANQTQLAQLDVSPITQ